MSLIFIATGRATMGINRVDKDGNITELVPSRFEFASDGPCVAVGELDPETMKINGDADLFGNWDTAGYLKRVQEKLKPVRRGNVPDLAAIIRAMHKDGVDVCEYCRTYNCRDCIVDQWKEEEDDDNS